MNHALFFVAPLALCAAAGSAHANLIVNGDFSAGNSGFITSYVFSAVNTDEGQYFIGTNPAAWNGALQTIADHTPTADGLMMLVNGNDQQLATIWEQTVSVSPGTTYKFAAWLASVFPVNFPQLQFSVNGQTLGAIFSSTGLGVWERFGANWTSGAGETQATIRIVNQSLATFGNDFALDDIDFDVIPAPGAAMMLAFAPLALSRRRR